MKNINLLYILFIPIITSSIFLTSCRTTTVDSVAYTASDKPSLIPSSSELSDALLMIKYDDTIYYSVGETINKEKFDDIKGTFLGKTSSIETEDINIAMDNFEEYFVSQPNLASNIVSPVNIYSLKGDSNRLLAEMDSSTYEIFKNEL